ncbi:cAMP-specific phosphodiesterase 4 [Paragonimus westermani]|uniref:Phosphodiesterase n=1 Tax=Paragonimus westermani TaxID=34504 RepID=A0A5J4NDS8_9TREM|nr:cAMP-specific phosphodiesterase 4 [Paragonimus westermani]
MHHSQVNKNTQILLVKQSACEFERLVRDFDWCLEVLESLQCKRSVSSLAREKFCSMLSRELSTSFSQSETNAGSVPNRLAEDGEEDNEASQVFMEGPDISKRYGVGKESTGGSAGSESYRQRPYLSKSGLATNHSSCSSQISDYIYQTFVESDMDEFFELNLKQNSHVGVDLIQQDGEVSKPNGTERSNVVSEMIEGEQTSNQSSSKKTSCHTISLINEDTMVDAQTSLIQLWNSQNDIDTKQVIQFIQTSGNSFAPDLFLLDQTSSHHTLSTFGLHIMQKSGILQKMSISLRQMHLCLIHVEASYNALAPFHNSIHATDVLQAMQTLFQFNKLESMFTDLEVFATLFACIVHDIDHPALTNQYLINTNNKLALLYNDNSVLENHHLHVAFSLLRSEPECDVTTGFTHQQRQLFRKVVISLVSPVGCLVNGICPQVI